MKLQTKNLLVIFNDKVNELSPAVHIQFVEHVADVLFYRIDADGKQAADLAVFFPSHSSRK